MLTALILFAQDKGDKVEGPGLLGPLLPLVPILILGYLFLILPMRKERQQRQSMMSALKENDRIVTSGGIIGVVLNMKEGAEELTIKSGDAKLNVLRSSIARILTEPKKETSSTPGSTSRG